MFDWLYQEPAKALIEQALLLLLLVAARLVPMVQLVPYLGGKATPQVVKMGLALGLSILVYPTLWTAGVAQQLPSDALGIGVLLAKEVLVGLTLGFVAALVFESVRMAGQMIDNARGQTMANAMAPQLPERISVSADLLYQLAIAVFLATGGHRLFIVALVRSYQAVPPNAMPMLEGEWSALALYVTRLAADSIVVAVLLAFPVVASVLLADVFLALVNKAAPQINVFFLGMPLKAVLGVAVVMLSMNFVVELFLDSAAENLQSILDLVALFEGEKR